LRGAHGQACPLVPRHRVPLSATCALVARSSNGRTSHFGCGYPGSNPGRAAPSDPGRVHRAVDRRSVTTQTDVGEPPRTGTLVAAIRAAGQGPRMRSRRHKVLHALGGKTLIARVLDLVDSAGAQHAVVVLGHQAEQVREVLPESIDIVVQEPQLGTGHAV